uniref:Uncharacterized protein n=1 Tax=Aegilops tauschii subsp. strangulata TaxID=200361 RepID=A0A453N299_AEGTS
MALRAHHARQRARDTTTDPSSISRPSATGRLHALTRVVHGICQRLKSCELLCVPCPTLPRRLPHFHSEGHNQPSDMDTAETLRTVTGG